MEHKGDTHRSGAGPVTGPATEPTTGLATKPATGPARVLLLSGSLDVQRAVTQCLQFDHEIEIETEGSMVAGITRFRSGIFDVVFVDVDGGPSADVDDNPPVYVDDNPSGDWMTAILRLRRIDQNAVIVMISAIPDRRHTRAHTDAYARGATDFVELPPAGASVVARDAFFRKLVTTIHALTKARRQSGPMRPMGAPAQEASPDKESAKSAYSLRPSVPTKPRALAIISSTGGPRALIAVLSALPRSIDVPVFITQHIPEDFIASLAHSITENTPWPCHSGVDGMEALPGYAYLAPGNRHMEVHPGHHLHPRIKITDTEPENRCKPSADPMVRSLGNLYGKDLLLVVLTGMGVDGLAGARQLVEYGGTVIAQDRETSVVWGMPGAVATAGLCAAVLPVDAIASEVTRLCRITAQVPGV